MKKGSRIGLILSYSTGNSTQKPKTYLIRVMDANRAESCQMIGHRVGWPASNPKIHGVIVGSHGRKGTLKARFKRGLPGEALATRISISD